MAKKKIIEFGGPEPIVKKHSTDIQMPIEPVVLQKNPPEFYGVEYLKSRMGCTGGKNRWDDNGAFYASALFTHTFFHHMKEHSYLGGRVLCVGAGRGWTIQHLRNCGFEADGCEYGREVLDHAVVEGLVYGDLTDRLPYEDNSYDMVRCLGVLSQLPEKFAQHAINELARVSRRWVWVNVLCVPDPAQYYHLNIKPGEWWEPLFLNAGLVLEPGADPIFNVYGFGRQETQWMRMWKKQ